MPSEAMKPPGFSPLSFFSDEVCFSDERQVGARKADHMNSYSGISSSPLGNRLAPNSEMEKGFGRPEYFLNRGRNATVSIAKHIVGAEREASHSLPSAASHDRGVRSNQDVESASYLFDANKVNLLGTQYESGLFSSSLSDLFSRNLKLSFNSSHGQSIGVSAAAPQYEEDEALGSLAELEAKTIGNLLPDDDDDLFSGVTDGLDSALRPHIGENIEDLDLFSSVGGLELGEDGFQRNIEISNLNSTNQLGLGDHPSGERPSRTLFVRNINSNVEDAELRNLFEQFGDIRELYTACKHRGFVMISYFDIRAASNAMKALQNKPLMRRRLDIHFSIPKDYPSDKDINQGTLIVLNLDSSVSNDQLHKIFGVYGEIKEIREASNRSSHKVVDYYDIRAAEYALHALNKFDIAGKQIQIEPGQPAGSTRSTEPFSFDLEQEESGFLLQQHSLPSNLETAFPGPLSLRGTAPMYDAGLIVGPRSTNGSVMSPILDNTLHHGMSSGIPNNLSSMVRGELGKNQPTITESVHLRNHLMFELHGSPNLHPHSLPEYHDGLANGPPFCSSSTMAANLRATEIIDGQQFRRVGSNAQSMELNEGFGSSGNGSGPSSGHQYMWNNPHHPQAQRMLWPGSPSFVNGIGAPRPQQLSSVPRAPSHMLNSLLPSNNHLVGSAPSVNHSIWERVHSFTGEPADGFHPGSLGNMRISGNNSPLALEFVPPNMFPRAGGNSMDGPISSKSIGLHPHNQRCMVFPARGQMLPVMTSFDSPNERSRSRRNEGSLYQTDNKKQFELDFDRILCGEDKRTTLMIKNIPNKYTSKMLLVAIDEHHKGTYDFIYLPIDFKNKCNVGYAFINMTDPSLIVPFYETFNGKKWEKFNSEKVASLAYARIQGKSALIAHFQNSSLMNEDKRCRPILFHTDGPNAGDQVPFPLGNNIRPRPGKVRASSTSEEKNSQEILVKSSTVEDFSNGDSSGKDLD